MSRALRQALLSTVAAFAACKTLIETQSAPDATVDSKAPQCTTGIGFHGTCQVTGVSGRQGTTTEAARESALGEVLELKLLVPANSANGHAEAHFFKKAGPIDDWAIVDALDLYSRTGCVAEVSGGVFGDGFTPKLTLRLLLNLQDDGRTGFAELADYRTGKPLFATLSVKCDWQK